MAAYRVNLDIFAGPLDLLLYLVRKDEVDIYDISIAKITDQYIRYIEMLKSFDIDLAGDFLVMAATLMQIKSAMLLPEAEPESALGGADDLADPRTELIRQLLEYKKFKDAANLLSDAADKQKEHFPRPDSIIKRLRPDAEPHIDIEQVSIWDLLEAFDSICKATGANLDISHIKDDTPIDLYQIEILHRLQTEGPMSFECIFESGANRVVMIGLFLALLELIRERLIWAKQPASSSSIYLRPLTDEPAEQAVQKAILAVAESTNEKSPKPKQQKQPHIPIDELSPKSKPAVSPGDLKRNKVRLATPDEYEKEKIESTKDHKQKRQINI
ncbi:Segregation and condensation protein A [subsurface metagenome]